VRRGKRVGFADYVDRKEESRLGRDINQLVENQRTVIVAPAQGLRSPVVTRKVSANRREPRRSQRTRKRPERFGQ